MDQYRTWYSGLKRALLYQDDQTLHSTTKIAATILIGIPEEVRGSTFVGQPGLLKILSNLQTALGSGSNADELKTALSNQVWLWERMKLIPIPTALPVSPPSSPSPSTIESSYGSDLATRQTRVCPASSTWGHSRSVLAPVPSFSEANAPSATFLQQRSASVLGEGFSGDGSKWNRVCPRVRGASRLDCVPFRDVVGRAANAKNNFRDSSEDLAAKMKKCNIDPHNPGMGLEVNNLLTQTFTDQQLFAVKYQELNMLVDLLYERDNEWTRRFAQDTNWRMAVDRKLQTILNVLDSPLRIGPSRTVANDNSRPDEGRTAYY